MCCTSSSAWRWLPPIRSFTSFSNSHDSQYVAVASLLKQAATLRPSLVRRRRLCLIEECRGSVGHCPFQRQQRQNSVIPPTNCLLPVRVRLKLTPFWLCR